MKAGIIRKEAFVVTGDISADKVLKNIDSQYQIGESHLQKINEHFFDTFDWRLYKKGCLLKRRGGTFSLTSTADQRIHFERGFSRKVFFPRELNDGDLRSILQSITDIRALINIFQIKVIRNQFDVLNKDEKTVLRIHVDRAQVVGSKPESTLPQVIYLEEVRGYEKAFSKVSRMLQKSGLQRLGKGNPLFQLALVAIDKKPLAYSSKFTITLEQSATVQETVNAICLNLVGAMKKNLGGIIGDIDSEFLHDFRIAIRRTRSLLSQMKKQLPLNIYSYFQDEFRWLGSITGPVRDLDVYLLKREEYQSILPAQLHSGLSEFFIDLERYRKSKLVNMRKDLTSPRYEKILSDWAQFLTNGVDESDWPEREKICKPITIKMIGKRYRRLIKDGCQITNQSPDEALHRLRIQGKKLRYLLEFYRSFFNTAEIDFFLKDLKKLQNNLGHFNDISVQQEMLVEFQDELIGSTKRSIVIAAALGGLISHLAEEQMRVRQKFEKTFSRFACGDNKEKFGNILS